MTPADLEAANANLVGGDSFSGSHHLDQLIIRPSVAGTRYRSGIPRLWLAGAGTWPGGGLNGISGGLAASQLLAEHRAGTVDGIGPEKVLIIPRLADNTLGSPTTLVADAHAAGLLLHPFTFRAENTFLPADYRIGENPADYGLIIDEMVAYLQTGIDGFFTDNPDIGVVARDASGR